MPLLGEMFILYRKAPLNSKTGQVVADSASSGGIVIMITGVTLESWASIQDNAATRSKLVTILLKSYSHCGKV